MDFFKDFVSNTTAGTSNQSFFTAGSGVGRVFYRLLWGGAFEYSLLFSNTVDSTFGNGSVSRANQLCGPWDISLSCCVCTGADDPELEDRRARSLSPQTERERRSIAKFTLQYERESIVHFLPFRQDLQQLLPALNYFWAPHSISGAGLAMLEAARAGVPVIASETESLGELFPQGACASVPTHHETTAIAAATYLLETHSDRRAEQIAAAHSALKKFSDAARFADAYFNLYAQDLP